MQAMAGQQQTPNKIQVQKIYLSQLQGLTESCRDHEQTFDLERYHGLLWSKVNSTIANWLTGDASFIEVYFEIFYMDGFTYKGRLEEWPGKFVSLSNHLRQRASFHAGQKPENMPEDIYLQALEYSNQEDREVSLMLLASYDIGPMI